MKKKIDVNKVEDAINKMNKSIDKCEKADGHLRKTLNKVIKKRWKRIMD